MRYYELLSFRTNTDTITLLQSSKIVTLPTEQPPQHTDGLSSTRGAEQQIRSWTTLDTHNTTLH